MPFTYLAHQAPALGLKKWWSARFDGTALALGTMAPDWAYALGGSRLAFDGHALPAVVLFCTPAAVLASMVVRAVAPALFANAPSPGWLPLGRLGGLAARRPLPVAAASAGLGALSHVVWDAFTHEHRWGPRHIGWLRSEAVSILGHALSWAKVLQYASHLLGSALALVLLSQVLRALPPAPEVDVRARGRFVLVAALGLGAGGGWAWGGPGLPAQITRTSLGLAAGLVVASAADAGRRRHRAGGPAPGRRAGRGRRRRPTPMRPAHHLRRQPS